jgi:hypothetical protein
MFSVVYCNAYFSDKSNTQKLEITTQIMFVAMVGPTDMPFIVLGHSVGVVGQ